MNLFRKPKVGVILIGAKRFKPLGTGAADETYEKRKAIEALKDVPTLKTVRAAKNIDDVHLIGSAAGILSTFKD